MVAHIFEVIAGAITQFLSALTSSINGITSLFYDATSGMTFLGTLLLIAVGVGIVYWAFNLIMSLVRRV